MTKDELSQLLDKKLKPFGELKDEIETLNGRLASLEDHMLTREDGAYIRSELRRLEKSLITLAGKQARLEKTVATKKALKAAEKRIIDFLNGDLAKTMQRVSRLEQLHPELPPFKPVAAD